MKKLHLIIALTILLAIKSFGQKNQIDSLNFTTETGLLVIEGYLNGVKTNFAFDTGASMGVLNSRNLNEAKIEITGTNKINDSQKRTAKIGKAKIDSLKIGSYTFKNITSAATDMPFLYCNKLYLLGGDVINKLNWKFDFQKSRVYISKEPFAPENQMTKASFKIIGNRHFSSFIIADVKIDQMLVDFGYAGICTMDIENKITKQILAKQNPTNIYKSKNFSMGLNSVSAGKESNSFYQDSVIFGNTSLKNFKIISSAKTDNKIGLSFLKQNFNQFIINNTELVYWLLPSKVMPKKSMNFDAGFYYNDNKKIEIVSLNSAIDNSASSLTIGQQIKSLNGRNAYSFADRCDFLAWYYEQTKQKEMFVEQLNGEKLTITKSIF